MKIRSRFAIRLLGRLLAACARLYFRLVQNRSPPHPAAHFSLREERGDGLSVLPVASQHPVRDLLRPVRSPGGTREPPCRRIVRGRHDGMRRPAADSRVNRRGGAAAMKEMLDATAELDIAIATDGPRGPHEVVKEGIIFLASHSGRPIMPTGVAASRAWRPWLKWTYLTIPKPFSRAVMVGGAPFWVPPDLSREEREVYRQKLQVEMDRLLDDCDADCGGGEGEFDGGMVRRPVSLKAEDQRLAA